MNDVTDNSRSLRVKSDTNVPYFEVRDGALILDSSFRESSSFRFRQSGWYRLGMWIRDRSRVLQAIHLAHFVYTTRVTVAQARRDNGAAREAGLDDSIYKEPVSQDWKDAWEVTERLVVQMRDEVESKGAKFLVVTLSAGDQIRPNVAVRKQLMEQLGVKNLFHADFRIKEIGNRNGIDVLTLAPELEAYADQHSEYLHGFGDRLGAGHWNATGHRVAGELIARRLCESNLITKSEIR